MMSFEQAKQKGTSANSYTDKIIVKLHSKERYLCPSADELLELEKRRHAVSSPCHVGGRGQKLSH